MIIEAFTEQKVAVQNIEAGGGLTKNEFLMQIYAEYQRLYNYFGRGENKVMKTLRQLRKV